MYLGNQKTKERSTKNMKKGHGAGFPHDEEQELIVALENAKRRNEKNKKVLDKIIRNLHNLELTPIKNIGELTDLDIEELTNLLE